MKKRTRIGRRNAAFQRIEALRRSRNKRTSEGAFIVDSVRAINLLFENLSWEIEALVYPADTARSDWANELLASERCGELVEISRELYPELCDREDAQELFAIARIPDDSERRIDLPEISSGDAPLILILDRINSPGNLGTLVRSSDALGVDGIVIFGHAADLYAPETVRASLGTLFTVPIIRSYAWAELDALITRVKDTFEDAEVIGSSANDGVHPEDLDLKKATLLILGNETSGMSRGFYERSDRYACVPMQGAASSMNIACAGTTLLYEAARQRRRR
mgnify:CR=1 FL=1